MCLAAGPVLSFLTLLLGERHQAALSAWPVTAGGARAGCYQSILLSVDLISRPLTPLPGKDWASVSHCPGYLYTTERRALDDMTSEGVLCRQQYAGTGPPWGWKAPRNEKAPYCPLCADKTNGSGLERLAVGTFRVS